MYTLIAAMIGVRLNYVIAFNPGYCLEHPLAILMVQRGGLSIQGGSDLRKAEGMIRRKRIMRRVIPVETQT